METDPLDRKLREKKMQNGNGSQHQHEELHETDPFDALNEPYTVRWSCSPECLQNLLNDARDSGFAAVSVFPEGPGFLAVLKCELEPEAIERVVMGLERLGTVQDAEA